MINMLDFSKDTGAGIPNVDNNHFPSKSYSSHQVRDVDGGQRRPSCAI
jgi:hypothetical protein